ncbi:hypothetical protein I4J89_37610 [Actinoplanes sp. NEAU-A11]|uniref:Uncharacterized protein n=1 Tax=Actinoplanes aureus TaxID=2792083 RepID=A0A931G1M4_9ACTN|nr:hypothetical protein [Actinoplanes aureus]
MWSLLFLAFLLLLGAVARERRSRRHFIDGGSAFWCRIRTSGGPPRAWRRLRRQWSRRMWARWSGDELVVRRGPVFDRTIRLTARVSPVGVYVVPPGEAKRCGQHPIAVRLWLRDGSLVEVTATEAERTELVGPFLAAAFSDLPKAPVPRREN